MRRLALVALVLACADGGPEAARLEPLSAYRCLGDSLPCVYNGPLGLPEVGKRFGVRARAPGALALRETMRIEWGAGEWWMFTRDTLASVIATAYGLSIPVRYVCWRVDVLATEGRIVHSDSLVWRW